MWVKICGTTNLNDALLAAQFGADALGFICASSVRQVTADQVSAITPHLPSHLQTVGVFSAWGAETIVITVKRTGLTAVQLHGEFNAELVNSLKQSLPAEITLIQAVHWAIGPEHSNATTISDKLQQIRESGAIDCVLIDSKLGSVSGGTGTRFDWDAAHDLFASHPGLILAGGLKPQNIREAVETLHPWGVDVASGVEAVAGRKSLEKLEQFIAEAKRL